MLKLFLLFIFYFYNVSANDNKELIFNQNPDVIKNVQFKGLNGENKTLKDYKNKIVIINFWATWCSPCIKEIPDLIKLEEKFSNKIKVLFVSVDSSPQKTIPKFIKKKKFENFDIFTDQDFKLSNQLNVKVMPTSLLVKNYKEISRISGYLNWLDLKIINQISKL